MSWRSTVIGRQSLFGISGKAGHVRLVNPDAPTDFSGWDRMPLGADWKGRDLYLWLHADAEIPAEWEGKRAVGVFDFGMTGDGNNFGFESLLYVDGRRYQGVDANHKEVFFKPEPTEKRSA